MPAMLVERFGCPAAVEARTRRCEAVSETMSNCTTCPTLIVAVEAQVEASVVKQGDPKKSPVYGRMIVRLESVMSANESTSRN